MISNKLKLDTLINLIDDNCYCSFRKSYKAERDFVMYNLPKIFYKTYFHVFLEDLHFCYKIGWLSDHDFIQGLDLNIDSNLFLILKLVDKNYFIFKPKFYYYD